jgi:hypothetical protein
MITSPRNLWAARFSSVAIRRPRRSGGFGPSVGRTPVRSAEGHEDLGSLGPAATLDGVRVPASNSVRALDLTMGDRCLVHVLMPGGPARDHGARTERQRGRHR